MAKHKVGKKVSKKSRISCKGNSKPAVKPVVYSDNNAMREAFMVAPLTDSVRFSRMGAAIIKAAQAPVKRSAEALRGWSANLSFRTYKALQAAGVMA